MALHPNDYRHLYDIDYEYLYYVSGMLWDNAYYRNLIQQIYEPRYRCYWNNKKRCLELWRQGKYFAQEMRDMVNGKHPIVRLERE